MYIRNNPLKAGDPCTNNGTMKHLERLKKMVTWAYTNEWIEKDPFIAYKLRFKRHEMEFLDKDELGPDREPGPGKPDVTPSPGFIRF